ncbi:MAG: cytochrome c3 family protein [Elusimicrobia bacterium]|nr:cytochrome c3 family protein [Elusimicrobiota bacterium]
MNDPADYKARSVSVALATAIVVSLSLLASSALGLKWLGNDEGYAPRQPIAFSHRLHAGELGVTCQYCHAGAERSRTAGLPPLATCMNCHSKVTASFLATRAEAEAAKRENRKPRPVASVELQKVYDALGVDHEGKPVAGKPPAPVRWARVYHLPDFVVFDHRPHVAAALACQTCHGPVETMETLRQAASLSMGWCVNCHRASKVEAPLLNWPKKASAASDRHASVDCKACHY